MAKKGVKIGEVRELREGEMAFVYPDGSVHATKMNRNGRKKKTTRSRKVSADPAKKTVSYTTKPKKRTSKKRTSKKK